MMPDATYDLVTLEPPPIAFAGVSALYSEEFYRLARSKLKNTGYLTQWLPAYQIPEDHVRAAVRAFIDVFPDAVLLAGTTQELILIGSPGGAPIVDPIVMLRRAAERGGVLPDLESIHLATPVEIAGLFLAPSPVIQRASEGVAPISDDHPIMEYGIFAFTRTNYPPDLMDVTAVKSWCPTCYEGDHLAPGFEALDAYLKVLGSFYGSDAFLRNDSRPSRIRLLPADDPAMETAFSASSFLRSTWRKTSSTKTSTAHPF